MEAHDLLPLVSVGIPTYNRESSLARAIESVLAQDYPNVELIISDNASTDGTRLLCEKYSTIIPRVKYLRQAQNRGPAANFTEVLTHSNGTLFMWLADDDWLTPNYVAQCADALRKDPELALVGGVAKYHHKDTWVSTGKPTGLMQDSPLWRLRRYYAEVSDNGIFYGLMRRDMAIRIPLRACLGGDWLFVAAMAYQGKVKTIKTAGICRSLGGASESIEQTARMLKVPVLQAKFPYLSIAANASVAVFAGDPVYSSSSVAERSLLAIVVFVQLVISKALLLNFRPVVSRAMQRVIGKDRYRRLRNKIRFGTYK